MKIKILVISLLLFLIIYPVVPCFAGIDTSSVRAVLVYDDTFNEIIFEKSASVKVYPASITKIMTAILVLENVDDLDQIVTASEHAVSLNRIGGSTTNIKAGEQLTYYDLLHALMIRSGNEVSYILAEAVAGSLSAFVDMMNEKSIYIGLTNTNFINSCGLHEKDHYSTARDLLKLSRYAMRYPLFSQIVMMPHLSLPPTNMHPEEGWADKHNTNLLLTDERFSSNVFTPYGIKTGSTPFAGYCLVSFVKLSHGNELYGIVLGAPNEDSLYEFNKYLYEKITEDHYEEKTLFDEDEIFAYYIHDEKRIPLFSSSPVSILVPNDFPVSKIEVKTIINDDIPLPLIAGESVGEINLFFEDKLISTFDLISKISYNYEIIEQNDNKQTYPAETDITNDGIIQSSSSFGRFIPVILSIISICILLMILILFTLKKDIYVKKNKSF